MYLVELHQINLITYTVMNNKITLVPANAMSSFIKMVAFQTILALDP